MAESINAHDCLPRELTGYESVTQWILHVVVKYNANKTFVLNFRFLINSTGRRRAIARSMAQLDVTNNAVYVDIDAPCLVIKQTLGK